MEAGISVVRTINNKPMEGLVKTERQCWENTQYSQRGTLDIVGSPNSVDNRVLEEMLCGVFKKTGVEIVKQNVQACHYLKEIQITIVKFVNRTDCLQILRIKKELKSLDPTMLEFPDMTKIFVNESLCPYYRGIWNKSQKLMAIQKIPVLCD